MVTVMQQYCPPTPKKLHNLARVSTVLRAITVSTGTRPCERSGYRGRSESENRGVRGQRITVALCAITVPAGGMRRWTSSCGK
jgi:hypothetical protein